MEALARLRPGSIAKIFLEWDQPWWPPGHVGINIGKTSLKMFEKAKIFSELKKYFLFSARSREELGSAALPGEWYKHVHSFSPVEAQPSLLLCWVTGEAAIVADTLEDDEVGDM